jgi:hypothetical protein
MSKQTAVQFLIEKIDFDANVRCFSKDEWKEIFEQAMQMEKEQIVDAYTECWMNDGGNGFHKVKEAESYYNETYGGQDEN